MKTYLLSAAALALLAGCSTGPAGGPSTFDGEVGSAVLGASDFGSATLNNTLVQTGQQQYALVLAERFASEVPPMVNFAFDSTTLDAEARRILDIQATWIRQFPELRFSVYGHTDLVGSDAYNRQLGQRRAQAVVNYLASRGVDINRLEALVSYGETQPLVLTQTRERANRRTVTQVSGFLTRHPTVLNGKYAEVIFREYIESATPQRATEGIDSGDFAG
ncbi:OmpA family protein [Pelagovum pacificum]|uniref:OmpA family protein n=1 Tax=Pelagovum pacificum TaxID=2588711 RepID=A0A5C5G938_9RHOB|nr:OmpA family protein [Pelagovum pacificum]QQA44985.1 OmpA family protein [Pelagovum pacificum]TNY31071.1 OmpA family protein [Pelagovum pacificum]